MVKKLSYDLAKLAIDAVVVVIAVLVIAVACGGPALQFGTFGWGS